MIARIISVNVKLVSTYFNVSSGFIRHLHEKLFGLSSRITGIEQQIQNVQVNGGTQVVDIRYEHVFSALRINITIFINSLKYILTLKIPKF